MEIYLVGGAVRDKLLGLPSSDRDYVVVGATPEEMIAQGFKPVGADFPVFLHPETGEEYALARTERKSGHGYKGFAIHTSPEVTLEDDLRRRDLTVNAMAETIDGQLIDPFNGAQDLANGILRHVSEAFGEDPVRILRVARFAARYGFKVADETIAMMQQMVNAGEVDHLVPERVWAEFDKALGETTPSRFFDVLHDCGALSRISPSLAVVYAKHTFLSVSSPYLRKDVSTFPLNLAAQITRDKHVRFASIVCDQSAWDISELYQSVKDLCTQLHVPNEYSDLALHTARQYKVCHNLFELQPEEILNLLESLDAFRQPERVELFTLVCEALDGKGTGYPQGRKLRDIFAAVRQLDTASIAAQAIAEGLVGKAIGLRIRESRIMVIKKYLEGNV